MAGALQYIAPVAQGVSLLSGLLGNHRASSDASYGRGLSREAIGQYQPIVDALMRLAQRGSSILDTDAQWRGLDAMDRQTEANESQSAIAALSGAGYAPSSSVFSRAAEGARMRGMARREQLRGESDRQNLLAQGNLWQLPASILSAMSGQGMNYSNLAMQNQQNLGGLAGAFASSLQNLFPTTPSAPISSPPTQGGSYGGGQGQVGAGFYLPYNLGYAQPRRGHMNF